MIHIFYFFGILYLVHELFTVLNPLNHTWKMERIHTFVKEYSGTKPNDLPPEIRKDLGSIIFHGFFSLAVIIWAFIGLLTDNWIVFITFLAFSFAIFSPISKFVRSKFEYGKAYTMLHIFGSLVDIGLIGFAIVNHYHLHINLLELFA